MAEVKALFKAYDVDSSGLIPSVDLCEILSKLNPSLDDKKIKQLLTGGGFSDDMLDYDAFLTWCCGGIPEKARQKWLEERWLPFVHELRSELRQVEMKAAHGFAETERLPSQAQFMLWGHRAIDLTEEVRGVGNGTPNVVFQVMMRMAQYDGVAPYRFEQVPIEWSKDGFIRVVDGVTRGSFYAHAPKPTGGKEQTGAIDESGNLKQSVKDSAIGNTTISNVMTSRDANMLVLGTMIRGITLKVVKKRQHQALSHLIDLTEGTERELLLHLKNSENVLPTPADAVAGREFLERTLKPADDTKSTDRAKQLLEAYESAGVQADNAAGKAFLLRGSPVRCFGQLHPDTKLQIQRLVEKMVDEDSNLDETEKELHEFVAFLRDHPGSLWKGDKEEHRQMLLKAQYSKKVVFMKREKIEKQTQHRFLPIRWTRSVELLEGRPDGEPPVMRRPVGQKESSRLRKNAFAYDDEHGLGLCSPANCLNDVLDVNALGSGQPKRGSKKERGGMDNFGEALVADEGAKLGNWFLTDIEKIVTEFAIMNVRGWNEVVDEFLPGEAPIMVGQNPRAASSIGATQHTQLSTASTGKWPILRLRAPGAATSRRQYKLAEGVLAQVELVQVGDKEDSVILRVETAVRAHAANPAVVKLLHKLRKELMLFYGGREIDFNIFAAANVHAPGSVITFTPLSNVAASPDNKAIWVNPDTQEKSNELGLPVQTNDFSQGKGNWMVWGSDAWGQSINGGRNIMGILYDFTRKPGVRQRLVSYLKESIDGWTDVAGKAEFDTEARAAHCTADEFWNATKPPE